MKAFKLLFEFGDIDYYAHWQTFNDANAVNNNFYKNFGQNTIKFCAMKAVVVALLTER